MNNNQKKSRESISSKIKRISSYIENGIPVQCDKMVINYIKIKSHC